MNDKITMEDIYDMISATDDCGCEGDFMPETPTERELVTIDDHLYEKYIEDGRTVYREYVQEPPPPLKRGFLKKMTFSYEDGIEYEVYFNNN